MIIHTVRRNESINSIAREYGVTTQRIIIDNNLYNLPYLVIGQAILIRIPDVVHTVRRGDTLSGIALQYGVSESELYQRNPNLTQRNTINIGEQIVIAYQNQGTSTIETYGYVYPYVRQNVLSGALPNITKCAIFGYGFRPDGTLIPINDQGIINFCYRYRTEPAMLISSLDENGNFNGDLASRVFNDITLQNTIINNIVEIMIEKGYRGIDIDFEYINADDSQAYAEFVRNVSQRANQNGFWVNVDLAPKTSTSQEGTLYEGHNYAALGDAANTVLIMTYEWGYTYGPPLAIAPLDQVRRVVEYAVTQIENQKIFLGIPNYAYDWPLPYRKGVTRAIAFGNEEAVLRAAQYGAQINFDETAQSPYYEYTAQNGVNHVVWFEDVRSISGKYSLVDEFNLRGGGYWNLMNPFTQNFAFVSSEYNIIKNI